MKVLFAVSNEEISESIVKKYQKSYKQIISYKNVYYFNAILKELQKDKTYDRIVISEDLEAFTHTQYDQIDKFIFEKLDSISDEASDVKGNDIPIILICSDRRTKSEQILVKLFGIGIYNAIIGSDRSVDEVCRLINRPRAKKEAKTYYKIESEDVNYQAENENDVSEMEIQNILAHYKRLGKNEERYVDSFNNIAAQYNDAQLRIISKFLPLNVRAVLEEKSPKYQQIMSFNNSVSDNLRVKKNKKEDEGPSEILLKTKNRETIMSKPVVIPSAVDMSGGKKLSRPKPKPTDDILDEETTYTSQSAIQTRSAHEVSENRVQTPVKEVEKSQEKRLNNIEVEAKTVKEAEKIQEERANNINIEEEQKVEQEVAQVTKRGRGRPRKNPLPEVKEETDVAEKRGRGRPRKNLTVEQKIEAIEEPAILPGFEELEENEENNYLPGFEETEKNEENNYLPGFEETEKNEENNYLPGFEETEKNEENNYLPGFEEQKEEENYLPGFEEPEKQNEHLQRTEEFATQGNFSQNYKALNNNSNYKIEEDRSYENNVDLSYLLTPDKKIVSFVGTSKNGTSFIVNNLAELMSSIGINTAILDTTKNRNSYYIYTKNEEALRETAAKSIEGLAEGITKGIKVNKNLTIYTSLPDENDAVKNVDKVLETLVKNHSLILIDTDFSTPKGYFKQSQETYLVQTMDVLTIQPLTAFLRDLKAKSILDEKKLKVVLNKYVKIKGIKEATIIGGMAYYNDPAMSFMTELFDRDRMKYVTIPFEDETYVNYLEGVIQCEISLKGYSKVFLQTLKELGNMVYPLVGTSKGNSTYRPPSAGETTFTPNMNSTLDKMKKGF